MTNKDYTKGILDYTDKLFTGIKNYVMESEEKFIDLSSYPYNIFLYDDYGDHIVKIKSLKYNEKNDSIEVNYTHIDDQEEFTNDILAFYPESYATIIESIEETIEEETSKSNKQTQNQII